MVGVINVDEDANKKSSTGMDPKIAVLLSYLFSWLGGLIFFLIEKENKFVKWNALQALILGAIGFLSMIVLSVILIWIPIIGPLFFSWLGWLIWGVAWVLAIICIVMGFQGKTFRIPGICKLADKYFKM
ncbi:MAG: DUF4870 domain-containing protein [Actinobacteria bacterium]|nr:DUF4870 domain-containing protein [Actinomycetota bacterium]